MATTAVAVRAVRRSSRGLLFTTLKCSSSLSRPSSSALQQQQQQRRQLWSSTSVPTRHGVLRLSGRALFNLTSSSSRTTTTPSLASCSSALSWTSSCCRSFSSGYPPHEVVGLPSLSPTMESGSIGSWNVGAGDSFGPGDSLATVETDKASVDFEAQDEGYVAKLLVEVGQEVNVGAPILITVEDADAVSAFADYTVEPASTAPSAEQEQEEEVVPDEPAEAAAAAAPPSPPPASAAPVSSSGSSSEHVFASPLARMLAQELGYSIADIPGTGPGGRIVAADVKEFVQPAQATTTAAAAAAAAVAAPGTAPTPPPPAAAPPVVAGAYTDYPTTEQERQTALSLMQSKRNVPHYYLTVDIACNKMLEMRQSFENGIGTYEFFIKAAAKAMESVPVANASWMDSVVRVYKDVDINIVTGPASAPQPVLKEAQNMGLQQMHDILQSAVPLNNDDDASSATDIPRGVGTFTMINLGMYGIKSCAPIIREPQACALALGVMENRVVPSEEEGEDFAEQVMVTATLSCDHRVVDGAVGAQWLAAFKSHVENPSTLLL